MALSTGSSRRVAHTLAVAVLAAVTLLCPVETAARVTIGLEAIAASGTHYEGPGTVSEQFVAPEFHLTFGGRRIEVQAEGIPLVGLSSSGLPETSATSATDLGFVDSSVRFALDPRARVWLGIGGIIINQQTIVTYPKKFAFIDFSEASHISGARYEVEVKLPVKRNAVIVQFAAMPALHGTVFFGCPGCIVAPPSEPETGAMTDAQAMFETARARSTWDFGVRFINYSAVLVPDQTLADRNVGSAISIRYSYSIGRL